MHIQEKHLVALDNVFSPWCESHTAVAMSVQTAWSEQQCVASHRFQVLFSSPQFPDGAQRDLLGFLNNSLFCQLMLYK